MKKGLSIITSMAFILTGVGIGTILPKMAIYDNVDAVVEEGVYNGMTYTSDGSEVCITGYTDDCDVYNLYIPDSIDGVPVTKIGAEAFERIYTFKKINLGKNVTSIGHAAFFDSDLSCKQITLPDNWNVNSSQFYYIFGSPCIEEIIIPETVVNVASNVFNEINTLQSYTVNENNQIYSDIDGILYNKNQTKLISYPSNKSIAKFVVPDTVTEISENAFSGLNDETIDYFDLGSNTFYIGDGSISSIIARIQELRISHDIEYLDNGIPGGYFSEDPCWTKLHISPDVTEIPAYFYNSSSSLEEIKVEEGNTSYYSESGILYTADKTELIKCPVKTQLRTYTVLNTTKKIGNSAFAYTNLDSVVIPPSVTEIHSKAFYNSKITKIKGYSGSYAEEFAKNYEYEFIDLGEPPIEVKYNFDVNNDGKKNVMDLMILKKYLLKVEL